MLVVPLAKQSWNNSCQGKKPLWSPYSISRQSELKQKIPSCSAKPLTHLFHQEKALALVESQKQKLCSPEKIAGFCESAGTAGSSRSLPCALPDGSKCKRGRVLPHSAAMEFFDEVDIAKVPIDTGKAVKKS